ncbi:MAG: TetR family transcriptional regulator [Streptosporangiales bacterium]|nr:TetR family transcriptional regulator [Streptosporangiales bacterium]
MRISSEVYGVDLRTQCILISMVGDVKLQTIRVGDVLGVEAAMPRRRLTRALVLETALAEIDEGGLEAGSMRALAGRLGVTPRALYRHVSDKDDLLRGVADLILMQMRLPPASLPWRRRVREVAFELRRVLTEHPHAVPIFARPATAAPRAVLAVTDAVLGALREADVDVERAVRTWYAIYNYTLGFILNQAGFPPGGRIDPRPDPFAGIDPGVIPFAAEAAPYLRRFAADGLFAADDQYQFGLDLLLDSVGREGR